MLMNSRVRFCMTHDYGSLIEYHDLSNITLVFIWSNSIYKLVTSLILHSYDILLDLKCALKAILGKFNGFR